MRVPRPLIVPDSKPSALWVSLGVTLLAGFIIRSLRRRHQAARTSREAVVTSTARTVKPAPVRARHRPRALLPASSVRNASRVANSHSTLCEES